MERLNEKSWAVYKISGNNGIFDIRATSSGIDGVRLGEGSDMVLPYITRTAGNNGIARFVSKAGNADVPIDEGQCVTIGLDTQTAYWQPADFITGQNIHVLAGEQLDKYSAQFVIPLLRLQMGKFNWGGNGATLGRMVRTSIKLPIALDGEPDFGYMRDFIKTHRQAMLAKYREYAERRVAEIEYKTIPALGKKNWADIELETVFTVGAGKRLTNADKIEGARPFTGATDHGNGITGFVGNDNASKDSNVLGVNYNGAPCIAFYHPYECIFTDDVKRLHLREYEDNVYVLLFMKTIIMQQRPKYSYGYKFNEYRMLRQKLMLPVDDSGKPDYAYMEQYSKNLMRRKYEQYLAFLDKQQ
jgi:hypothetical protein